MKQGGVVAKEKVIKHSEFLKYKFSEPEMREHAQSLARENQELESVEREKAMVVSSFKTRATEAQAKVSRFAAWIREGYEHRMIECETKLHQPEQGEKETVRLDTGEVVKVQRMTPDEMQEELPL